MARSTLGTPMRRQMLHGRAARDCFLIRLAAVFQATLLGRDHPDVLLSRYNLGCVLADGGDHVTRGR